MICMKEIYYECIGEGFPIILLHGNGENHHIFDDTVQVLSKKYKCILIDSRYHGQSIHQGELSYQQMCKDVINVIDELNLQEYDLLGFSDGAIIGLLLAMEDQRLKHLISIGANTKPKYMKLFFRIFTYIQTFCLLPFCIYQKKARQSFRLNRLMLKEPHIEYDDLKNIHSCVLVMAGQYDMIQEKDTKAIAKALPYSVLKIIKQGNHFLLRDNFLETIHQIELFLEVCHKEEKYEA